MAINRICITGPESTGKTVLGEELAKRFNTVCVPEFARQYLSESEGQYSIEDLKVIAKGQIELEENLLTEIIENPDKEYSSFIFLDTDLITISIWMKDKFNAVDSNLEKIILDKRSDLYLLSYPDLEWEYDPQREDEFRLFEIFEMYQSYLEKINAKYFIVKGRDEQRIENAIRSIEATYPNSK